MVGDGEPRPGEVLAERWIVERVIGRGGMGTVVAARDVRMHERVALKLMHAHELKNGVAVERFFREARAALRLQTPHVTRMREVDRLPDGRPYMVMELLEGDDLARVLKQRGALPVTEAARYVQQAAAACAVAHAAGVVHRDLKPSNLFLATSAGAPPCIKLLDFGISKLSGLRGTVGHALTADGDLTGSPLYMPPEQLRARDVDGRADVWALGATLYELLTARRPFQADSMMAECNRILVEAPAPPSSLRSGVPAGLDRVVLRCLEKDAARRFQSAAELEAALAPFAATPRASGRGAVVAVLVLLAALAAGSVYAVRRLAPHTAAPPASAAPP
ncbi:MAG TPA: serine/threonine-protein kinase [Minicystis sp.]|nr:serine/threonine-protein kinase [Minicystis sp.]